MIRPGLFGQAIDRCNQDRPSGFARFVGNHAIGFPARWHSNQVTRAQKGSDIGDFADEPDLRTVPSQRAQLRLVFAKSAQQQFASGKMPGAKRAHQRVEALLPIEPPISADAQDRAR